MLRFLRWIFGNDAAEVENRRVDKAAKPVHRSSRSRQNRVSDVYFDLMSRMRTAISNRDYHGAAALVHENLGVIPEWVKETRRDYGSFDIRSIPALEQGGDDARPSRRRGRPCSDAQSRRVVARAGAMG